ncbi:MAG: phosphatidylserine decarboxylase family protein [Chloroflexi bacterium]|nr:phosphatidylserine decarboxylase family protein [Chloroflexota bacterium]
MQKYGADKAWPFAQGGGATIAVATIVWATAVSLWFLYSNLVTGILLFLFSALWLMILYFFRDPNRNVINEPGQVIGPGDGEVVEIIKEVETRYLNEEVIRISMFLDVTDVHVQRVPFNGKVLVVDHQPGKFLQAFRPEASEVNEYIAMVTESEYGRILIKQIAGILARRCVNYMQPGDEVTTGQRFGIIRFSSRLDLYLPTDAKLLVKVGDKVYGGLTPIAQLLLNTDSV